MTTFGANERQYARTVRAIGLTLLVFLLLLNLFSIFYAYALPAIGNAVGLSGVGYEVFDQLIYAVGYLGSFMLPVFLLAHRIKRSGYPYLHVKAQLSLSPWLPAILFTGISVIFLFGYFNATLVSVFNYSEFSSEYLWGETGEKSEWFEVVLNFIVIGMVPAFCEEFLFRGAILTNLLPFGRGNAIFISALLFGLMHQNAEQILYAFAAGILLGLVYERTGSIWNCVFLHFVNNSVSVIFSVLSAGVPALQANSLTLALTCVFAVIGACCIVPLIFYFAPVKQEFREGVFGKSVCANDSYASVEIAPKRAFRLFLNLPMILFFVFVVIEIVGLIFLSVVTPYVAG